MIGTGKALIQGLYAIQLQIRRNDEAVDDIVLGIYRVRRVVGLIEQDQLPAGPL